MVTPWLVARGVESTRLIGWGMPLSMAAMAAILLLGPAAGAGAWAVFCGCSTVIALAQPAVGMALPAALAGRALSAYNLVVFAGIFAVQWGVGLAIDALQALGLESDRRLPWRIGVISGLLRAVLPLLPADRPT